jgi:hypothetical protein
VVPTADEPPGTRAALLVEQRHPAAHEAIAEFLWTAPTFAERVSRIERAMPLWRLMAGKAPDLPEGAVYTSAHAEFVAAALNRARAARRTPFADLFAGQTGKADPKTLLDHPDDAIARNAAWLRGRRGLSLAWAEGRWSIRR